MVRSRGAEKYQGMSKGNGGKRGIRCIRGIGGNIYCLGWETYPLVGRHKPVWVSWEVHLLVFLGGTYFNGFGLGGTYIR